MTTDSGHDQCQLRAPSLLPYEGPVHTALGEFCFAALFPRLGLPSTLIRHENEGI